MNGHEAGKRCDERALLKHTIETTLTTSRRRRSSHLFSMEKKKRGKPPAPEEDAPKKLPPPAFFSGRRREDEEEEEKKTSSSVHWDSFRGFLNEKHTDDDAFKARVKARYHAAGSRDSCGLFSLGRGWQELCVAARPPGGGRSSGSFCATRSQRGLGFLWEEDRNNKKEEEEKRKEEEG